MNIIDHKQMVSESKRHTLVMNALASEHEVLLHLLAGSSFHYVDIPVHGNIGDLLIMQGTLAFFSKHGIRPRITAPAFAYDDTWIREDEVVVFHGGGNFGDLYADFGMQALRERVVATHPNNRFIVLPQTIHFSSKTERERSAKLFRQHPDVHLCVRDAASHEIALEFSEHVYLLPDMAHQLYRVRSDSASNPSGNLRISRTDDEKLGASISEDWPIHTTTDWPALLGDSERHIETFRQVIRKSHRLGLTRVANRLLMDSWARYSQMLVSNAIELFAHHEHIFTDRLHGHILACLMDKPNTVIDNSYGKNSSYVGAWTGHSDLVSIQRI
jgi:pyruvyl transferase EpsO